VKAAFKFARRRHLADLQSRSAEDFPHTVFVTATVPKKEPGCNHPMKVGRTNQGKEPQTTVFVQQGHLIPIWPADAAICVSSDGSRDSWATLKRRRLRLMTRTLALGSTCPAQVKI
jgi:hypothetical protein